MSRWYVSARSRNGGSRPWFVHVCLSPPHGATCAAVRQWRLANGDSSPETLRLIHIFVPRITYGRVVQRPEAPPGQPEHQQRERPSANISDGDPASPRGNAHSQTLTSASDAQPGTEPAAEARIQKAKAAAAAFAHVKRDLVRLLGILASHDRTVQDRVRECSGIPVVMNLCVVDDYNPCKSGLSLLLFRRRRFPRNRVCGGFAAHVCGSVERRAFWNRG